MYTNSALGRRGKHVRESIDFTESVCLLAPLIGTAMCCELCTHVVFMDTSSHSSPRPSSCGHVRTAEPLKSLNNLVCLRQSFHGPACGVGEGLFEQGDRAGRTRMLAEEPNSMLASKKTCLVFVAPRGAKCGSLNGTKPAEPPCNSRRVPCAQGVRGHQRWEPSSCERAGTGHKSKSKSKSKSKRERERVK